jgi:putative transposase
MKLKSLLLDERFKYWPVSSIAYYAQRNNILPVGLSTFYKYAKLLGVYRSKYVKPKPHVGIRATAPNQIWHGDITIFKINNTTYYMYFLIDNYSRFVLNYFVSTQKSGLIWKKILSDSLATYKPNNAQLLVDDGSEINNQFVDELLKQKPEVLQKIIAQKDITFSNSMVEALNKIVKNNYLRMMGIHSGKRLTEMVDFVVDDYNNLRPHGSLNGSTPYEIFNNTPWDKSAQTELIKLAKKRRIEENRKKRCKMCF